MPSNPKGEITIEIGDKTYTAKATVGALADIETGLRLESLDELGPRLGKLRIADLIVVTKALIDGGGKVISEKEIRGINMDQMMQITAALGDAFPESPTKAAKTKKRKRSPGKR